MAYMNEVTPGTFQFARIQKREVVAAAAFGGESWAHRAAIAEVAVAGEFGG